MQNGLFSTRVEARCANRGDLSVRSCSICTFTFNAAFDDKVMQYDTTYDNSIDASPAYQAYRAERISDVMRATNQNARILEIGCGKGSFIRQLVGTHPSTRGIGVDMTYDGELSAFDGRLTFERRYFDASDSCSQTDVAICRHVIEHIADPVAFLREIRGGLAGSPDALVIFETPSLEWIVENEAFWDITYEHCNYFTRRALERCFAAAGFVVVVAKRVFGEQFWWIEAVAGDRNDDTRSSAQLLEEIITFGQRSADLIEAMRRQLHGLSLKGNLALWGAGGKGSTLTNLLDPQAEIIQTLIDLNPRKQGCFVAGTGHPIVAPLGLISYDIANALVVNPIYLAENALIASDLGSRAHVFALR